ncbi:hypothetical protein Tco_1061723 [Tanacetum coccineum]
MSGLCQSSSLSLEKFLLYDLYIHYLSWILISFFPSSLLEGWIPSSWELFGLGKNDGSRSASISNSQSGPLPTMLGALSLNLICKFSATILVLLLNTLKALLFKEYPTKKPSSALPSN